ncbi:PEP-CTERM sorting domain-containing protein [Paludibaculum fermentans]|uniref:PEP-CTERM sorting domain-containing protein n=1 Tax=Paludibaculum fermentans TaxID=1473598 RepID=UPI003EB982A8
MKNPNNAQTVRHVLLPAVILMAIMGTAQAAPIYGTITVGGSAEVTQTTIDYDPIIAGDPLNGTGDLGALAPGTGVFSTLGFLDPGTIVDRSVTAGVVPAQPAGVPILVMNWLTFTNPAFRYALDLTFIDIGSYSSLDCGAPEAVSQTCTPSAPAPFQSPYNLSNFNDSTAGLSSNANFSVRGVMRNLDTGLIDYNFNGVFGAEFLGQSYQDVLAAVSVPGGSVVASYSGTINATSAAVPEPSTGLLAGIGAGLLGLSILRRKK